MTKSPPDSSKVASPAAADEEPVTGAAAIRGYLTSLSTGPGVYRMVDAKGGVLYVGKAKNLRRRVSSYTKPGSQSNRIARMIRATASMEFVTTATEADALLLEANLIKRLKPRYNILLRDDKAFPQILIRGGHDFPRILKHRGARRAPGKYFGPFASAGAVNRTLNQLQKAFLLRSCTDSVFANRTRPCLLHQIRRCSAPCVGTVTTAEYAGQVADAERFLRGQSTRVQEQLAQRMQAASESMNYEQAAVLRDRIRALTEVQVTQGVNPQHLEAADLFALHVDGGAGCVQAVFYRSNQHWGDRAYYPRFGPEDRPEDILRAFIGQFYTDRIPPARILLSHEIEQRTLVQEALTSRLGRQVQVTVPQRGEPKLLLERALTNAREALGRHMAAAGVRVRLLESVATAFELESPPQRIEVFDASHIQGAQPVVAMVVSGPEGFMKSQYRKFNMDSDDITPGDDLAMLRSALERRFGRLMREDPDRGKGQWPDLVLIDGGQTQLAAALDAMANQGVESVPIAAIAKGPDRNAGREVFHMPGRASFSFRDRDPALYFLQRLRDEAHRFVIGAHRGRRAKQAARSLLDVIPGVGAARKRALLERFGSAKAVGNATPTDLATVHGISRELAHRIHDELRDSS